MTLLHQQLQELPLPELIERLNQPCGIENCRHTTRYVSQDFCPVHRLYYREYERRKRAMHESYVARLARSSASD